MSSQKKLQLNYYNYLANIISNNPFRQLRINNQRKNEATISHFHNKKTKFFVMLTTYERETP